MNNGKILLWNCYAKKCLLILAPFISFGLGVFFCLIYIYHWNDNEDQTENSMSLHIIDNQHVVVETYTRKMDEEIITYEIPIDKLCYVVQDRFGTSFFTQAIIQGNDNVSCKTLEAVCYQFRAGGWGGEFLILYKEKLIPFYQTFSPNWCFDIEKEKPPVQIELNNDVVEIDGNSFKISEIRPLLERLTENGSRPLEVVCKTVSTLKNLQELLYEYYTLWSLPIFCKARCT